MKNYRFIFKDYDCTVADCDDDLVAGNVLRWLFDEELMFNVAIIWKLDDIHYWAIIHADEENGIEEEAFIVHAYCNDELDFDCRSFKNMKVEPDVSSFKKVLYAKSAY